jgi:hypothetical protein
VGAWLCFKVSFKDYSLFFPLRRDAALTACPWR